MTSPLSQSSVRCVFWFNGWIMGSLKRRTMDDGQQWIDKSMTVKSTIHDGIEVTKVVLVHTEMFSPTQDIATKFEVICIWKDGKHCKSLSLHVYFLTISSQDMRLNRLYRLFVVKRELKVANLQYSFELQYRYCCSYGS
jgi:hypothetical protein